MKKTNQEIKQKELQKRLKNGTLKFVGFITERQINSLKKELLYYRSNNTDLLADLFGTEKENIYIYEKLKGGKN